MRAAKGHAKHRTSGALRVAVGECCQFYYQNRQCRQRLVKRRTGEARTVWAAIRRRCQFKRYNRQCEQQKVTRSTAPVVPRGLRKGGVVNLKDIIDNTCSNRSQAAWQSHALRVAVSYFGTTTRIPIYKNKKCSIRKGTLYVKPTTRGVRSRGIRLLTIQVSFVYISCKVFVCINISPNAIFQHFNPPQYNRNEYTFIFCW